MANRRRKGRKHEFAGRRSILLSRLLAIRVHGGIEPNGTIRSSVLLWPSGRRGIWENPWWAFDPRPVHPHLAVSSRKSARARRKTCNFPQLRCKQARSMGTELDGRLRSWNLGAHQYPELLAVAPSFHRVRQTKLLILRRRARDRFEPPTSQLLTNMLHADRPLSIRASHSSPQSCETKLVDLGIPQRQRHILCVAVVHHARYF